jgi:hypothetical protein
MPKVWPNLWVTDWTPPAPPSQQNCSGDGDCSSDPGTTDNDHVIAYDTVSGRWSSELPIDSDCASF